MSSEKILLLHGPVDSYGHNGVSQTLVVAEQDYSDRDPDDLYYNCRPNIVALANAFRARGFKIAYSGWEDDRVWLTKNARHFDCCCFSVQNDIKNRTEWMGIKVSNNKDRFYYIVSQGLKLIRENVTGNANVFRMRSDIAVDPALALQEMARLEAHPQQLIIEYLNADNLHKMPDFLSTASLEVLEAIYHGLAERSRAGQGHHVSSHMEHFLAYLLAKEAGIVSDIVCMGKNIFDSLVWRGVPRYLEYSVSDFTRTLFFDGSLSVPPAMTAQSIINSIAPELAVQNTGYLEYSKDQRPG
jgi:hypothetical protein